MLTKLLLFAGAAYLAIALAMFFGQWKLIYLPDDEARVDPKSLGLAGVEERILKAPDGAEVVAWYGKAKPGQPTLLYFHGNAGSLASRSERVRKYQGRGRGILMMSYRGYSGGTGSPSQTANIADAARAYEALIADGVAAEDIIVYGESLGSGVAVPLAASKKVAGLILDAPFTSLGDMAQYHYPWLPARPMIFDRYDNARAIGRVNVPVLIVHGELDSTTPVAFGEALYAKANAPKELKIFKGAGHADHYMFGSYEAINAWIDRVRAQK